MSLRPHLKRINMVFFTKMSWWKLRKNQGKTLRKSGKSQGKIREFDGIKKVGTLHVRTSLLASFHFWGSCSLDNRNSNVSFVQLSIGRIAFWRHLSVTIYICHKMIENSELRTIGGLQRVTLVNFFASRFWEVMKTYQWKFVILCMHVKWGGTLPKVIEFVWTFFALRSGGNAKDLPRERSHPNKQPGKTVTT